MQLFSDRKRTEDSPDTGSKFEVYDRSAWPGVEQFRQRCNEWFAHFPAVAQADLRARFRSSDNDQHNSAWFELVLHEILLRLGCTIEAAHPNVPNTVTRPDFLVQANDTRFYLEAMVIHASSDDRIVTPIEDEVSRWINAIPNPNFTLSLHVTGELREQPRKREVTRAIERLMAKHNPADVRRLVADGTPAPRTTLTFGDWSLEAKLVPSDNGIADGLTIGNPPMSSSVVDKADELRTQKITEKLRAKDDDELDAPLVLAVALSTHLYEPKQDLLPMLLGKALQRRNPKTGARAIYRRGDAGVWVRNDGSQRHLNCQALWVFPSPWISYSTPQWYQPWLALNPFVDVDLPDQLLQVPRVSATWESANQGAIRWSDGVDLYTLLTNNL